MCIKYCNGAHKGVIQPKWDYIGSNTGKLLRIGANVLKYGQITVNTTKCRYLPTNTCKHRYLPTFDLIEGICAQIPTASLNGKGQH